MTPLPPESKLLQEKISAHFGKIPQEASEAVKRQVNDLFFPPSFPKALVGKAFHIKYPAEERRSKFRYPGKFKEVLDKAKYNLKSILPLFKAAVDEKNTPQEVLGKISLLKSSLNSVISAKDIDFLHANAEKLREDVNTGNLRLKLKEGETSDRRDLRALFFHALLDQYHTWLFLSKIKGEMGKD